MKLKVRRRKIEEVELTEEQELLCRHLDDELIIDYFRTLNMYTSTYTPYSGRTNTYGSMRRIRNNNCDPTDEEMKAYYINQLVSLGFDDISTNSIEEASKICRRKTFIWEQ